MANLAYVIRGLFIGLGIPLSILGIVFLFGAFTGESLASWRDAALAASFILMGCITLMTAFLADLVIRAIDG